MGTKQVRLEEDVYAKIKDEKRDDESFSDAIDRLTSDWSLVEWSGWLDESAASEHRKALDELEATDRKQTEQLLETLDIEVE
jgi:predicted CopG family antitoxin